MSSLEFFKSKTVILAKAEAEREDRKHPDLHAITASWVK